MTIGQHQKNRKIKMSNIPEGLKSKYNKDSKFIWVDAQLEKFMEKQKELEDRMILLP